MIIRLLHRLTVWFSVWRMFKVYPWQWEYGRRFLRHLQAQLRDCLNPSPLLYTPPTIYGPDPTTLARRQQIWSVNEAYGHALSILRAKVDQLCADADRLRS